MAVQRWRRKYSPQTFRQNGVVRVTELLVAEIPVVLQIADREVGSEPWWRALSHRGIPFKKSLKKSVNEKRPASEAEQEVTFFWRQRPGRKIETVFIEVYSHTPHAVREAPTPMQRFADSNVWYWQTRLPKNWCGSYFFVPVQPTDLPVPDGGERRRWWLDLIERRASADPFNPVPPHNGAWGGPLSGIYPAGISWLHLTPTNELREILWHSERLNSTRPVWLYRTGAGGTASKLPLVLLLDGHYWRRQENFLGELDQRTASGELPAAAYLMIDAIDGEHRGRELPCNNEFWLALQQELLPQVAKLAPITERAENTLVAGQSFGGLAAVWAALNWPQRFGHAFSQSGSFWWPLANAEKFDLADESLDAWVGDITIKHPRNTTSPRFVLEAGKYEPHMLDGNRGLRDALEKQGIPATYREVPGGHDWLCWRRNLVDGISEILGA